MIAKAKTIVASVGRNAAAPPPGPRGDSGGGGRRRPPSSPPSVAVGCPGVVSFAQSNFDIAPLLGKLRHAASVVLIIGPVSPRLRGNAASKLAGSMRSPQRAR